MVFSSLTFLFLFLPIVSFCIFIRNRSLQNMILLLASLIFYSWGEPKSILLLCLTTALAYFSGILQERLKETNKNSLRKSVFIITIALIIANLFIFKYLGFFTKNLGFLGVNEISLALPIGISFYTFQILSYSIDLYLGKIRLQKNFFYLLMYVSFFPQLIAGPIVRYETIEQEIENRRITVNDVASGLRRFTVGLAKKVLLANQVASVATTIYAGDVEAYGAMMYWIAAIAYTLQIYFDFSGYSDMAIGLGRMFGFHFLENFNYPYIATSVTDFWRRWHISLSSWFRDYVYIPLGGNRTSKIKWLRNILIVWMLTGFWHGAEWNFIIWGLYYGILLLIEKFWLGNLLNKLPKVIQWLYTMVIVCIGWVIFNITDLSQLLCTLKHMFTISSASFVTSMAAEVSVITGMLMMPIAVVCAMPLLTHFQLKNEVWDTMIKNILCVILYVVCIAFIISESFQPFIYFRF